MNVYCCILLILVVNSYVLCDIDLHSKEKRDFQQEIDRLFNLEYFHRDLNRSPKSRESNDKVLKTHVTFAESKPLSAPDWSVDTVGVDDYQYDEIDSENGPEPNQPPAVSKTTSNKDRADFEGSGQQTDDEDDYEDLGSGMEEKRPIEFLPEHAVFTSSEIDLFLNPEYVKCGTSLQREAYSCVGLALNFRTFLNEIQIQTQIVLHLKANHLKLSYSIFMPFFRVCIDEINSLSSCEGYRDEKNQFVYTMINQMIDFAKERDRLLVQATSTDDDSRCLASNLMGIWGCMDKITNDQVDHVVRLLHLRSSNWTLGGCNHFQRMAYCTANSLLFCVDEITLRLISVVSKGDVITTCQPQGVTTERDHSNEHTEVPINHEELTTEENDSNEYTETPVSHKDLTTEDSNEYTEAPVSHEDLTTEESHSNEYTEAPVSHEDLTTERNHSNNYTEAQINHANIGLPLETLLILTISILASRF